jgi:hypothetical protein
MTVETKKKKKRDYPLLVGKEVIISDPISGYSGHFLF